MAQRDSLLRSGISLIGSSLVVRGSFDADLTTGRNADLTVSHDTFAGLHALFDHNLIALTLTQSDLSLIDRHVLLNYINVRSFGRHLRRGCGHQHSTVNRLKNQANVYKTSWPEFSIGIRHGRTQIHLSGLVLD